MWFFLANLFLQPTMFSAPPPPLLAALYWTGAPYAQAFVRKKLQMLQKKPWAGIKFIDKFEEDTLPVLFC